MGKLSTEQINGIASKGALLLSGITGIAGAAVNNSKIANTSDIENKISSIDNYSNSNYNSFSQINSAFENIGNIQPDISYDAVRGGSNEERAVNLLSSTATGALTGLTVGGPWGALAGAVVGLGSGIGGWLMGNKLAEGKQKELRTNYIYAINNANTGLNNNAERLLDTQFRNGAVNSSMNGGSIKRQQSLSEFAESVLNKSRSRSYNPNSMVVREMCDGGIRIRIKR